MPSTPFQLIVTGKAEVAHLAELAIINVSVSSSGINEASVSDKVITTAKHIESLLGPLSPQDHTAKAKKAAPIAHWSKTSLSSTSHGLYHHQDPDQPPIRQYNVAISFDIHFGEFEALSSFGTKLSSISHVEVQNISWILTDATLKSFETELREKAAQDAVEKAWDYCNVLGCYANVQPVELQEGDARSTMSAGFGGGGRRGAENGFFGGGGYYGESAVAAQYVQTATVSRSIQQARKGMGDSEDARTEGLRFDAQDVKMAMEVTVRFQADLDV